jgi:hypothetical protein
VPWQGGWGEARGRGVGRWGTEVRGAAASANYEDIALPATISSILIARAKIKVNFLQEGRAIDGAILLYKPTSARVRG